MKRIVPILVMIMSGCSAEMSQTNAEAFKYAISGEAQGTTWSVSYYDLQERDFTASVDSILQRVDASISTYQEGSVIDRWNKSDSGGEIDRLFADLLVESWEVYVLTEGAFDPSIKPLVSYWGFGPERFAHPDEVDQLEIEKLLDLVHFDTLSLIIGEQVYSMAEVTPKRLNSADYYYLTKPIAGMQLDFNAIGQGWSVDLVTKFLIEKGVKVFFMELGGEIVAGYPKPDGSLWRFGIDQPTDGNLDRALQAIIELRNKGLATSGNYRKFYEKDGQRFAHTIDPRTGYPVQHNLLSATVVSQNAGKADALATAFMVMGMDSTIQMLEEKSYIGSHVYLIADDGSGGFQTYLSKQLEGMLKEQ
jgi:thiamine biosynthesis lipoprotein